MLKIMIVDDEYYFRQALKISIQWEKLGFTICAEAKNGKEALEKFNEHRPDIILLDINMPIMNGLELVDELNRSEKKPKIIILSGYNEFSYAKKALTLGVNDYLLKPIEEDEIIETLLKMKKMINGEEISKTEIKKLKEKVDENIPIVKEKMLNDIIHGNVDFSDSELIEYINYLGIKLKSDCYIAIVMEVDDIEQKKWSVEEKQMWYFAVSNIAKDFFIDFNYELCYDTNCRLCILIEKEDSLTFDIDVILNNIKSCVKSFLKFTVTTGIGNACKSINDLSSSYNEAIYALKNKIVVGSDSIIYYDAIEESHINKTPFSSEKSNEILMSMRIGNIDEVNQIIESAFRNLKNEKSGKDIFGIACIQLLALNIEFVAESGYKYSIIYNKDNHLEYLQSKNSVEDMVNCIKDIFKTSIEFVSENKKTKTSKLANSIISYIENNYSNPDLKIEDISRHTFTNSSHLCFVFKKETGKTIIEFLTEKRINKAKELIDAGNHTVFDVAERVGYEDSNYFSRCFKKTYGLPPSKYIEKLKND